jgi:uroporphyrinogen decarboxylase
LNMDTGSKTKPLLRALSGEKLKVPPFWLMRQAGRYLPEYRELRALVPSFLELCLTPELAVEATLQPLRRFEMDAAIVFSDILLIPFALGQKVEFRDGPILTPIRSRSDIDRLDCGAMRERLAPVYETLHQLHRSLSLETTLIGFAGAPWTLATYMVEGGPSRDFAAVKAWAGEPDFAKLIELLVEAVAAHLTAQIEAGAEAVQIFDTWAGALDGVELARLVTEPTAEIIRRVKERHPYVPVIGFPRGIGSAYVDYARKTGVDAVSLDQTVEVTWAVREIQSLCPVQGNLDPQVLVAGGAALRDEARRILSGFAGGPFIFNLGHGVLPETPPEHVAELARLIRASGAN